MKELDGGDEVALPDRHDQVDGIEVAFAVKATAEIGARVDCREEFLAPGAEKAQTSFAPLVRPLQLTQEMANGDVVTKLVKEFLGEAFGHDGGLLWRDVQGK